MAARKGIRAKVLERLTREPMTGRQIEAMYVELGGAVDKRNRVSFDTMRHLLNSLPLRESASSTPCKIRSRMLDRTYSINPERVAEQEEYRTRAQRSKELLQSLLSGS